MTADEVLEAMARAAAEAAHRMPWSNIPAMGQEQWLDCIRAAIRAVTERGGLVVAKVPAFKRGDDDLSAYQQGAEVGWNNCLSAVRASAVEVE